MATAVQIARFLNKLLRVRKIKESSRNGLQFKGMSQVKKIGFAVDSCMEAFENAAKLGCDMIIIHHGVLWKGKKKYVDAISRRKRFLKKKNISLYGAHLPLDLHEKYGNNICLCRILGLRKIKKFGRYHGFMIGYEGELEKPKTTNEIAKILNRELKTKSIVLSFGKKKNKTIAVVSGGGAEAGNEAVKKKIDLFVTGELNHEWHHSAKDSNINMIAAGHYNTETLGVRALMPVLKQKFNIETVFIDIPTKI